MNDKKFIAYCVALICACIWLRGKGDMGEVSRQMSRMYDLIDVDRFRPL